MRSFWVILVCILLLRFALRVRERYFSGNLIVTFFDIGQGDAALVQFPYGKTMLIDAGGGWNRWNAGSRVILPELARLSLLSLNAAVMTHPDRDHAYGFYGLLGELSIDEFWYAAKFDQWNEIASKASQEKLRSWSDLRTLASKHSKLRPFENLTEFQWNGVYFKVIAAQPLDSRRNETNNRSLITHFQFGACSILMTGDIERPSEQWLKTQNLRKVSLLKVAHHGSKTSSTPEFLAWARPRWSVISVGIGNHYGHPNKTVIENLQKTGNVFRTDLHGFVQFSFTKSGSVSCRTSHGECGVSHCSHFR